MENRRREKFVTPTFSPRSNGLIISQRERWRTLLWTVFWLVGIPVGMIGYLSMLLWAYGAAG